jgi:hypothetical protein
MVGDLARRLLTAIVVHDLYDAVLSHAPRAERIVRLDQRRKPVVALGTKRKPPISLAQALAPQLSGRLGTDTHFDDVPQRLISRRFVRNWREQT